MTEKIVRERRGYVEIVTINRPEVRNALDSESQAALVAAFRAIDADPAVRVGIVTGTGDRSFSAGMDLREFSSNERPPRDANANANIVTFSRSVFDKPVIAAVNGAAVAGGFEVMLACDLVVAAEHAVFGIPEAKRGLLAAGGGLVRLPKRVPYAVALEMALTGDTFNAQRAYELGLVNQVVPAPDLMAAALALAERIAVNGPKAVRVSKQVMQIAATSSEAEGWAACAAASPEVFNGPDAREGARAFVEKRQPVWTEQ